MCIRSYCSAKLGLDENLGTILWFSFRTAQPIQLGDQTSDPFFAGQAKTMEDIEVPPLRTLQDFILESARFSSPAINDPQRFANRLVDNLLYYQTNYFLLAVIIFLLVGFMNPKAMMIGIIVVIVVCGVFVYFSNNKREMQKFKTNHPLFCAFSILLAASLIIYLFGSILVFVWGIILPLAVIMLHAAFRMRNLKNKMSKKLESLGIKRTPMGIFLFELGLEDQARS